MRRLGRPLLDRVRSGHAQLGFKAKTGQKGGGRKKIKGKGLTNFEMLQTYEFKYKLEFKHTKAMHQQVCNNKPL
jgi:hypothetical protein